MSRAIKTLFLINMIVDLLFGLFLYLKPGILAGWFYWTPFDRHVTRLYGAALLALAFGSFLGYRAAKWDEVRILVLCKIALGVLSIIAGLWIIFFSMGPAFTWVGIVLWVVFTAAWAYVYTRAAEA